MSTTPDTQHKILIVDDSRMVRIGLSKQLSAKFSLREAVDGEEGWQAVMLDPAVSVVITDTDMPKLDGYGLLDRVRGSKINRIRNLPVIIIAGAENEQERERAKQRGATDLIGKSIGAAELSSRVEVMLELSNKQRELDAMQEQLEQAKADAQAKVDEAVAQAVAQVQIQATEPTLTPDGRDMRTGLPATAVFLAEANRVFSYTQRHEEDLALIMFRVGSESASANDALPVPISKLLKKVVRNEDIVSMTAPLEFCILSKGVSMNSALTFAKRLNHALLNAKVKLQGDRIDVPLNVQGGVVTLRADHPQDLDAMLSLAGERTEQARAEGGNRVIGALHIGETSGPEPERVDASKALAMIKEGRLDELQPYLPSLHTQLAPLLAQLKQAGLI